jgi:serine/threonine protein kinase
MAQLIKVGDYVGKGEKPTAEHLASNLPEDWTVIANVVLPGRQLSEVDLIIIGKNLIFVCEEKSWGPLIVAGQSKWQTTEYGNEETSPIFKIENKAKALSSQIGKWFPQYSNIGRDRPVVSAVILSHPDLDLRGTLPEHHLVFGLAESVEEFKYLDEEFKTDFATHRIPCIRKIAGLDPRPEKLKYIKDYLVLKDLGVFDQVQRFEAEHIYNGSRVMLYCFPDYIADADRHIRAIEKLRDTRRTWQSNDRFKFQTLSWDVLPLRYPGGGVSLDQFPGANNESNEWVKSESIEDWTDAEIALFFSDAFRGLSELHSEQVIHRAICPERLWIEKSNRFLFHDFFQAREPTNGTISFKATDSLSENFAAPECKDDLHQASEKSDVFSLSSSLGSWWQSFESEAKIGLPDWLQSRGAIGQLLIECLNIQKDERPEAAEIASSLQAFAYSELEPESEQPAAPGFEAGNLVGSYLIEERLGEGGGNHVWLATHEVEQTLYTIKQAKHKNDFESARKHISEAQKINHPSCQKYKTASLTPEPGYFVYEYIDGVTLTKKHSLSNLSTDDFRKLVVEAFTVLSKAFHENGLVHGDISPENLLVDEDLNLYFVDLESVSGFGSTVEKATRKVAAPEVLNGDRKYSEATDVYSLAATFLLVMLARNPFAGSATDVNRDGTLKPLSDHEKETWQLDGTAILDALFEGLTVDPAQRPSALQMAEKIRRAKKVKPLKEPKIGQINLINPVVEQLRQTYIRSKSGNEGLLAIRNEFFEATYADTQLDLDLLPEIIAGNLQCVVLAGNPGDGKTTFLQNVNAKLHQAGAFTIEEDLSGWTLELDGTKFTALLDASESHNGSSSNKRLQEALNLASENSNHSLLIAINDGRLSQFLVDNDGDFPDLQEAHESYTSNSDGISGKTTIVNLKSRSLTNLTDGGLAGQIINKVVDPSLWESNNCQECASQNQCPIFQNVRSIRDGGSEGIETLTRMSYVAASKRATVREFRSTLSWLITADRGCKDVHEARQKGEDLTLGDHSMYWDLAFTSALEGEKLLTEWQGWDPELVHGAAQSISRATFIQNEDSALDSSARKIFFISDLSHALDRTDLLPYRYSSDFFEVLIANSASEPAKNKLLQGLSRLFGAQAIQGEGLWLSGRKTTENWEFLRRLSVDQFVLATPITHHKWTEAFPNVLELTFHGTQGKIKLPINLDVFEVVMRAADGEIFGDVDSAATIQFLEPVMRRIGQDSGFGGVLVSPLGIKHIVEVVDNSIEYKGIQ